MVQRDRNITVIESNGLIPVTPTAFLRRKKTWEKTWAVFSPAFCEKAVFVTPNPVSVIFINAVFYYLLNENVAVFLWLD